jgi:hypothetical protein
LRAMPCPMRPRPMNPMRSLRAASLMVVFLFL